jgi:oxepin-CoA hydrolase/3-oxo-5,6-dehydrosuberyl-CoA semialdehyde dehydrogenase
MAKKIKFHILQTENELKPGFKAPNLPVDRLLDLNDANIGEAIDNLINEIKTFEQFKRENSEVRPINPIMGEMEWSDWVIFHNKHIRHHLRQFKLID